MTDILTIYGKATVDRTPADYDQISTFLRSCELFTTLRDTKVINESSIVDLIKQMRFVKLSDAGSAVYEYGSTEAPHNSGNLADMEAFIVVSGSVEIRAPQLVKNVSVAELREK